MNKKGAEMTIGTIIAITLGVALLVFLIFGFSTQWKSFQGTINPLTSADSNIDNEARGCEFACASNNFFDYCKKKITLNFGKDYCTEVDGACVNTKTGTCQNLEADLGVTCDIC